jgi:hypothetical protein
MLALDDPTVRGLAARTIGTIGPKAAGAAPKLVRVPVVAPVRIARLAWLTISRPSAVGLQRSVHCGEIECRSLSLIGQQTLQTMQ